VNNNDSRKLAFFAAIVAAVLAVTAAVIQYAKDGRINAALLAASLLMIAFAFACRRAPRSR
jgi:uncharacterized membrane protein YoaK (UPF0700 family)